MTEPAENLEVAEPATDEPAPEGEPAAADGDAAGSGELPSEAASPAEGGAPPAEETPEAKDTREREERRQQRIKAAEKAEMRAQRARAEARQARELEHLRAERARLARVVEQRENETRAEAELRGRVERGEAHPDELLRRYGTTYQGLTRQMLEANNPEAIARAALARAERLENQLAEQRTQDQQRAMRQQQAAAVQREVHGFGAYLEEQAEAFPHAFELPPSVRDPMMEAVVRDYARKHGEGPSYEYVAAKVDERAKLLQDEQQQRREQRSRLKSTPGSGATTTHRQNAQSPSAARAGTRTLSASDAATRASPPRRMTDEEVDEWALEQLRAARRK